MKTIEEIKKHLRRGDYIKIAAISGVTVANLRKTLKRPKSKRFSSLVEEAQKMADYNESIGL